MSNEDVHLPEISDCKLNVFNMVLNYHSQFDGLSDGSIPVESTIGIVDRYRTYEFLSINMVGFNGCKSQYSHCQGGLGSHGNDCHQVS